MHFKISYFFSLQDNIKNYTLNTTQQIVDSYFLTVDMVLLYKYDLLDCGEHLIAFCDIEKKSEQIQSFESPRYCSGWFVLSRRTDFVCNGQAIFKIMFISPYMCQILSPGIV